MDTSDEWIRQRSGIQERRYISQGQLPADLAEAASRRALAAAGREADEIDCIVLATLSPQADFPGTSFFLQDKLGAGEIPCFDVRAQCSGFLFSLATAKSFVEAGQFRRVLVVGCEVHSTGIDLSNEGRDVAVLFGDGAGAVVVEANDDPADPSAILEVRMHAQGKYAQKLWIEAPGSGFAPVRITEELIRERRHFPRMDGKFVFKHAVTRMPEVLLETLDAASVKKDDVDLFLFHQANLRINEYVAQALEIPAEKLRNNIQRYGNCSAASIPMLLDEAVKEGVVEPGRLVSMTGFGSGFSWASAVVRW
jgi:3-oxoacyl-[acyl-carrier-protein] synthase-3